VEPTDPVLAAGAVVWREVSTRVQLLLVHRPRGDWTFPKGKADPEERLPVTAVRETAEETGLQIRLGVPLRTLDYPLATGQTKRVTFWCARPHGDGDLAFDVNDEIDDLAWIDLDKTADTLTYDTDRDVLDDFVKLLPGQAHRSSPLVVLRHAKALPRRQWHRKDRRRPLAEQGVRDAQRLVPLLAAYGIRTVVSSDSSRCVQTVAPYAEAAGVEVVLDRGLSQEDAGPERVARRVAKVVGNRKPTVVCTHRPVLPLVFESIGVDDPALHPGQLLVVHRRGATVVATELHGP